MGNLFGAKSEIDTKLRGCYATLRILGIDFSITYSWRYFEDPLLLFSVAIRDIFLNVGAFGLFFSVGRYHKVTVPLD